MKTLTSAIACLLVLTVSLTVAAKEPLANSEELDLVSDDQAEDGDARDEAKSQSAYERALRAQEEAQKAQDEAVRAQERAQKAYEQARDSEELKRVARRIAKKIGRGKCSIQRHSRRSNSYQSRTVRSF